MSSIIKSSDIEDHSVHSFTLKDIFDERKEDKLYTSQDKKSGGYAAHGGDDKDSFISEFSDDKRKGSNEFVLDISGDIKSDEDRKKELERKYIEEAKKKAEDIKQRAYEEGLTEANRQLKASIDTFYNALTGLKDVKEKFFKNIEGEIVELVCAVARAAVNQELITNKDLIINLIKGMMEKVKEQDFFIIKVNPKDLDHVISCEGDIKNGLNGKKGMEIVEDKAIERGACSIETNFYTIHSNVLEHFENIEDGLKRL